jgi:hypothetical protein
MRPRNRAYSQSPIPRAFCWRAAAAACECLVRVIVRRIGKWFRMGVVKSKEWKNECGGECAMCSARYLETVVLEKGNVGEGELSRQVGRNGGDGGRKLRGERSLRKQKHARSAATSWPMPLNPSAKYHAPQLYISSSQVEQYAAKYKYKMDAVDFTYNKTKQKQR